MLRDIDPATPNLQFRPIIERCGCCFLLSPLTRSADFALTTLTQGQHYHQTCSTTAHHFALTLHLLPPNQLLSLSAIFWLRGTLEKPHNRSSILCRSPVFDKNISHSKISHLVYPLYLVMPQRACATINTVCLSKAMVCSVILSLGPGSSLNT